VGKAHAPKARSRASGLNKRVRRAHAKVVRNDAARRNPPSRQQLVDYGAQERA
jgi:hypothetical protein